MKNTRFICILIILVYLMACKPSTRKENIETFQRPDIKLSSDIITPEVLWSFGRVSDVQVTPDNSKILYGITYYNIKNNKGNRDLYIIPITGEEPVNLTNSPNGEYSGTWRPDGNKIGYLSAKNGAMQLWEMDPDGKNQKQITNVEEGINGFKYSPDMTKILYVKNVKLDKDIHDIYPDLPLANARIEEDLMYRHWDTWHDYKYSHIFIADYNNGTVSNPKDIMENEIFDSPLNPFGGMEQINWSPDSKKIAYTCKKLKGKAYTLSTNSEIYIYNIDNEKTINLTENLMGYDIGPVFSPDGTKIAWESMERDGYESDKNRLFIHDFTTGIHKDVTTNFNQNVHGLVWTPDNKSIYFTSDYLAEFQIYNLNIDSEEISQITKGVHNYLSVTPAGNVLIGSKQSMSMPTEIFSINPENGKETQITFTNKNILDQLTLGNVEERWIKTTDNKEMKTWVIYPPHFDGNKKYPALLYCQGGPQSSVSQFFSYRWNFQIMAANNYIIVAPNRRGLPSFGKEWNEQISRDYGGQNMKDYFSAIDELAMEEFVDENNLGAIGASYGGFSVFWLAGNHNKRFKAFIAHDGIFNFENMYLSTEEKFFVNWDLGGPYWNKEKENCWDASPHRFVQNWDTPILVIHGEKDFRIPVTEGMSAFNAAQLKNIPSKFLYFPEENHWVLNPQNGILWQRVFFDWLDTWLKN